MSIVDRIAVDRPELYAGPADSTQSYELETAALKWLHASVAPGAITLETGSGWSTVIMADVAAQHFAVDPCEGNWWLIEDYCGEVGVSVDNVTFMPMKSVDLLRKMVPIKPGRLDIGIIDGAHGFPHPQIDWYIMAGLLKVGGLLLVDDLQLQPPYELAQFLAADPDWTRIWSGKWSCVFRMEREWEDKHWMQQPFVATWKRPQPWKRRRRRRGRRRRRK